MKKQPTVGVIVMIVLMITGTTLVLTSQSLYGAGGKGAAIGLRSTAAPIAISGDNVYITWQSNRTGNDEVNFRASTNDGTSFGDKINLSNSTNAESQNVEVATDGDNVIITWWERNQTAEEPVARISSDNGQTFGPVLRLVTNGTIGQAAAAEE